MEISYGLNTIGKALGLSSVTSPKSVVGPFHTLGSLLIRGWPLLNFANDAHVLSMTKIVAFLRDESGATAIEYGLIATGIAIGCLPVLIVTGSHLKSTFLGLSTALK
jgi:pilus assembly protein Flp/PilA